MPSPDLPVAPSFRRLARSIAVILLATACTGPPGSPGRSSSSSVPPLVLRVRSAAFALPRPVEREVAVSAGDRIYLAGGLDAAGASVNTVYELDVATGALASRGVMPQPFHDGAGVILGRRLVVFGGGTGEGTNVVQSIGLNGRGPSVIGHLPIPLSDLGAATVNGTVYLVGGYDGSTPQRAILATTDGVRFRPVGRLPVGLRYPAVTEANGRVIIAGGVSATGPVDSVLSFDPDTGRVETVSRLPAALGHAAAFTLEGRVFVLGGEDETGSPLATVTEVDPRTGAVGPVQRMSAPVSDAGVTVVADVAWILGGDRGAAVNAILRAVLRPAPAAPTPSAQASTSTSDAAVRPFAGLMVVADRGNNRLLVLDAAKHVVWRYPSPDLPPPPHRFYFPDDAFWVHGGHALLVNEEENDVLIEIAYPSGKVLWTYGHAGVAGSAPGYLHQPDDLYPALGGGAVVADAMNCRLLFFDRGGHPARQIGRTGVCKHGLPRTVGYPNGDTPLSNGDFLISELNGGWIDQVSPSGVPRWSIHVPGVAVPSDPQRLADGTYLAVDYESPGRVVRFTSSGHVVWSYGPKSGRGALDHPSLAALLPNGLVAVNDDYRDRVVLIDPATNRIVWQLGVTGHAGSSSGYLAVPDGLDLLLPDGTTPLHIDFDTSSVRKGRP